MYSTNRKSCLPLLFLLLLLGGAPEVMAQNGILDIRPKLNSPLSRFGLGNPVDQFYAAQAGMGGVTSVYQNAFHLNVENPASLASLAATSLEVGGYGRFANLTDARGSATTTQGNLRYLALGFPLRNPINLSFERDPNIWNAGMAFSLAPTSNVGYDLALSDTDAEFGETTNTLLGNGSAYRFRWSTAARYRSFSLGLNVNYNFGKLTNSRIVSFDDVPEALASELVEDLSLNGFNFGYGLQYTYNFKKLNKDGKSVPDGRRIIVGVNGEIGRQIETESSQLFRRFSPNNQLAILDTLSSETGLAGTLDLPSAFTVGLAYEKINKLFVGVEYGRRNNSDYRNSSRPETLLDANRFAFGIQYVPNAGSYNKFAQRIRYRAGVRLEGDGRSVNGVQARRNALTLGVGLPFRLPRQQISFLDLGLEFGQFGVPNILDENYVQFTVGFSLNDNRWFLQRKLN